MERLANVNRHHLWFTGREYRKSNLLNRLRTHQGFIIPMNLYDHRDLHHDLRSTPKPSPLAIEGLLEHIGSYDPMSERTDYLDLAINFLKEENPVTAAHLARQRGFILLHPFTLIEREMVEREHCEGAHGGTAA